MNFEFESKELQDFMKNIAESSCKLIDEIIKENSPIQIGEDVRTIQYAGNIEILRVTKITLWAIDSWGNPGKKLSFEYEGLPLRKNGEPMKHRNPVWFDAFEKKDKKYYMPSYNRIKVKSAKTHY